MEETPPSKSAVTTFFVRLGQRYQLLLGMSADKNHLSNIPRNGGNINDGFVHLPCDYDQKLCDDGK